MKRITSIFIVLSLCALPAFGGKVLRKDGCGIHQINLEWTGFRVPNPPDNEFLFSNVSAYDSAAKSRETDFGVYSVPEGLVYECDSKQCSEYGIVLMPQDHVFEGNPQPEQKWYWCEYTNADDRWIPLDFKDNCDENTIELHNKKNTNIKAKEHKNGNTYLLNIDADTLCRLPTQEQKDVTETTAKTDEVADTADVPEQKQEQKQESPETDTKTIGDPCESNGAETAEYKNIDNQIKCAATKCKKDYYLVVDDEKKSRGWCLHKNHCKGNKVLNIIDGTKTDQKCIDKTEEQTQPATTTTNTTEHNTNTTSACPACDDACKKKLHATDVYCDEDTRGWKPVDCENGYEGYGQPTTEREKNGEEITYYDICLSENTPECEYQAITDTTLLEYAECSYLCYQESYQQECKLADAETIVDVTDPNKVIACLCNATEEQILAYKASLSATQEEEDFPNLLQEVVVTADSPQTRIENLITQLANCIKKIEAPAP